MTTAALFPALISTTKVKDLVELLERIQTSGYRIAWKPVGGIDNNLAIVNLGSDPAAGVIERITNALDAILELEWQSRGQPPHVVSPRQAAEKWFAIPGGRLASLKGTDLRKLEDLSSRVQVSLRDSDRTDKPTVDIRDAGIGVLPEEFADSILSLNKNRKLRKLFLAGAFGQGGSTALAYSPFTMIFSRKTDSGGQTQPLGFTVVRFNPGDPNVDKHGVYEYLVDAKTGTPLVLDASLDDFPPGTLVRHLTMEVGKYSAVMTAPTGSLWFLTHNYLFDPVLPFRIQDLRTGKNPAARTVAGNHRLLTQGEHTEYQREATLTFRDGSVTIKWWVLSAEGESARARLTQYVTVSKPIVITYNGQKQGDFPNTVIKDDLKLPYLDRYLIVHVDCDRLDAESRRQLFPTTREALRDTPIGDDLRRLVIDTLYGDSDLKRLDLERKQRYLRQDDSSAVDNIRRRLARRVQVFSMGGGQGPGARMAPPESEPAPSRRQPIPIQDPPTFIKITTASPRKIYAGRSFTLRFETDGRPEYFASPDNFIAVLNPPSIGQFTGTTSVRDGYGVAYFRAAETVEIGATARITLELRPPRSQSISDGIDVVVVDLPQTAGSGEGEAKTPNINPHWVAEGDAFWVDNGWTAASVAKVTREEESIDIWVSAGNERLSALISRAQRRDLNAVEAVKGFYLEHVSFYALLQDIDRTRRAENAGQEENAEDYTEIGLRHVCETVCGIIEGLFEILVTAPNE